MSIPKEPRQLMINIMYLVLTALLALNVSAEIFNAFEMVDNSLSSANTSLDASNKGMPALIKEEAKKKASFQTYADRVDGVASLSSEASSYIEDIVNKLIDESGDRNGTVDEGDYVYIGDNQKKELRGKKDYDATTRLMVDSGEGMKLRQKMIDIRNQFLAFADSTAEDRAQLDKELTINIDDQAWQDSPNKKKDWADFTFGHMPLGATMPIFTKFQNDIKSSEAAVLNYLAGKVGAGGETVVLDKFAVVSSPKKSYIIKGEKFETDIFLSASAGTDSQTGLTISVGGQNLRPDKEGVARYTATPNSVGIKKFNASITIIDPVTEERKTFKKEFEYEVGERSVSVSASKMNVFYIGVDNPVEVSAAGVNSTEVKVSMGGSGGGTIKKNGDGTYTVNVTNPTRKGDFAKINVTAPGMNASKDFRVKRIPDPVPMLGRERGGTVGNGTFKAYGGVNAVLDGFDFDAKCRISEYVLIHSPKRKDPVFSKNEGGKYNAKSTGLVNAAKPGDKYIFQGIKCRCPGDKAGRDIGQLVFDIK